MSNLVYLEPKVMQSDTRKKDMLDKIVHSQPTFVFDSAIPLVCKHIRTKKRGTLAFVINMSSLVSNDFSTKDAANIQAVLIQQSLISNFFRWYIQIFN
jgi:hypothetical protein